MSRKPTVRAPAPRGRGVPRAGQHRDPSFYGRRDGTGGGGSGEIHQVVTVRVSDLTETVMGETPDPGWESMFQPRSSPTIRIARSHKEIYLVRTHEALPGTNLPAHHAVTVRVYDPQDVDAQALLDGIADLLDRLRKAKDTQQQRSALAPRGPRALHPGATDETPELVDNSSVDS